MILRVCLKFKRFLDVYVKRTIHILIIIFGLNIFIIPPAIAAGGIIAAIKAATLVMKGYGDNIISTVDDLFRGGKGKIEKLNNKDEILKQLDNKKIAQSTESLDKNFLLEKVGSEAHAVEFKNFKDSSRPEYIKFLRKNNADNLIDDNLFDIYENITSDNSKYSTSFKSYVLLNWIGKIYIKSNYFNKPKFEDKTILVCKNIDQVFYLSLFMEQEPKRAFLTKNLKFKKNTKNISSQELFIIEDTEKRKIMVTWPVNTEFPQNYFVIYPNQNFYYENPSSGTVSPEQFKKYLSKRKSFKNKCFKATESGLL